MKTEPIFLIVDLFCGAGGTSTGFGMAQHEGKSMAKVIACVNHDAKAIESHWKNHPEVKHFEEDIRTLDLTDLIKLTHQQRLLYPNAKLILWASLECTNFSKAKGGQPRDADSRTLAEHLDRYIAALHPDYIQIENVVEFMSWGPLDENGKPVSRKNGSDWMRWRGHIKSLGYYDDWKELNSADFGAYTSRNRLFGCFAKHGLPIAWPMATHAKKPATGNLFGPNVHKWKAVKDVLDFEDEGESIFARKKELSPKTLERIYAGLIKYVAGGKDAFIQQTYACASNNAANYPVDQPESRNTSVEEPCKSVLTANTHVLVNTAFIAKYYSGKPEGKVIPVTGPAGTIKCADGQSLVQPKFIVHRNSGNPDGGWSHSTDLPCPVIIARQDKKPLYLLLVEHAPVSIPVYEDEPQIMVDIKIFMCLYGISDIKMRMLKVLELLKIQGFPEGYILAGNQSDQKKFIGNSVVPWVVKAWCEAMGIKIIEINTMAA